MSDLQSLALDFARAFNKAVRSFRMYSPTHPQVAHDLADAFGWLEKMTVVESPVAGVGATQRNQTRFCGTVLPSVERELE